MGGRGENVRLTNISFAVAASLLQWRVSWLVGFALLSVAAVSALPGLELDTGFSKAIPATHPYMRVFHQYAAEFGGGNRVLIALHQKQGDIFQAEFFEALEAASKEVFFLPGVDKARVTSLFTPNVRFTEVIEGGFTGGRVIPADFTPSTAMLQQVRRNILKSEQARNLVSADHKTTLIRAELVELDPVSGQRLDYLQVARQLEQLRQRFESQYVSVHIIGFAQFMGEVNRGLQTVIGFFALTVVLAALFLVVISRKLSLGVAVLSATLVAVVWMLALLTVLDIAMHPFGILVPFLVFAVGISHGLQMLFAWHNEFQHTTDSVQASVSGLHKLMLPGLIALLSDCIGFLTILHIDLGVMRDTAISASIGIALLIISNLLLLPILLSYCAPTQQPRHERQWLNHLWLQLSRFGEPRYALITVCIGGLLLLAGAYKASQLPTGDLQQGVSELRESSRYNQDVRFINDQFRLNMDLLTVFAQTHADGCVDYEVMRRIDDFGWQMQLVDDVLAVSVLTQVAKTNYSGWHEGSLKWHTLPRHPAALGESISPVETSSGLLNHDCSVMPVYIYLSDHRAETLNRVIQQVRFVIDELNNDTLRFTLAGGNAGIIAATNEVVAKEQVPIIASVYTAIIILCLLSFRSFKAAFSIVIPLAVVSVLTYALMAELQIGLNVSTLPIVALGAGIGVDYAIYLYAQIQAGLKANKDFNEAYRLALRSEGKAVFYTAVILSIGVALWNFSPLKYQADMGLLLTFSFVLNMVAALLLIPSIAALLQKRR